MATGTAIKPMATSGGLTSAWAMVKQTFAEWNQDKVPQLGAALAFYTALSIAPLLVLMLRVAGIFFGAEAARGEIDRQLLALVGPTGAKAIEEMLRNAMRPDAGAAATVLSIATLVFGA